jgi:uncharacterized protein YndB with AHSA1/START domain
MTKADSDRIEKEITLRAPRSRVWRALTDSKEFGAWFQAELSGPFIPGAHVTGNSRYPGFEHLTINLWVEQLEPEHRFSFRWHPYAIEPEVDYSAEPTTLVSFQLEETAAGTLLRIVESGFAQIPEARRAKAFEMNSHGWSEQLSNIQRHLGKTV